MNLRHLISAAALAFAMPFAATAATVTSNGVVGDPLSATGGEVDVFLGGSYTITFDGGTDAPNTGDTLLFVLKNNSLDTAAFTVASTTVNSTGGYGFMNGVNTWLENGLGDFLAEGAGGFKKYEFTLAAGDSLDFTTTFGDSFASGNGVPFINFSVYATAVPIPAAGFLLIGALGGLAMVRRKTTA